MKDKFAKNWKRYLAKVYPEGTEEEQRKQLYLAFHAGALCFYKEIIASVSDDGPRSAAAVRSLAEEVSSACQSYADQHKTMN